MNAEEARNKAMKINSLASNGQYILIKENIETEVCKGEYETYFYGNLINNVREKLESEGFTITEINGRNETDYLITW